MLRNSKNMKTRSFNRGSLWLLLTMIPLLAGCDQQSATSSQGFIAVAAAEPAVAGTNGSPAAAIPETTAALAEKPEPVPAALEEKPLPPSIKASSLPKPAWTTR